jgi:hypothetical protein
VTSARKIRANRANARASSGPKTAAGKAQSAQNAFRHGFNVPIWLDPALASDVEALALRIAGNGADASVREPARRVAEAQIDLRRVRSYRTRLIERAMPDPKAQAEATEPPPFAPAAPRVGADDHGRILCADPLEAQISVLAAKVTKTLAELMRPASLSDRLAELARELAALDRYERRALSRRKFAIREFDLAHVEAERRTRDVGAASFGGVGKPIEAAIPSFLGAGLIGPDILSFGKSSGR